jgi:sulfide:quinone oxidoreductase
MDPADHPVRVLVVGGGVAALEATLALQALAGGLAEVDVLAPEKEFTYRPLSFVAPFGAGEASRFPLEQLVAEAGARLRSGTLARLEPDRRVAVTGGGEEIAYDLCLLAPGARPCEAVPGALTLLRPGDQESLRALLADARENRIGSLVIAVPAGVSWALPAYELALLAAAHVADACTDLDITLVTPEEAPLVVFGARASDAIRELLELRGITISTHTTPVAFGKGRLSVAPDGVIYADRALALPRLDGSSVEGVPCDDAGFIPTDSHGAVVGLTDVFAAGDATTFPLKQGGIAAQQADAAAEAIARRLGVEIDPQPFRPILRGLLLTGLAPRFLRAESHGRLSAIDTEALWWPPAKIVGRHLAPFLASRVGLAGPPDDLLAEAMEVEVELDPVHPGAWAPV